MNISATTYKKALMILFLIFTVVVTFFIVSMQNRASAEEQLMSCPISKRVPIGSSIDQTIYSLDALLANTQAILDRASHVYQLAGSIVSKAETGCNPNNCESGCEHKIEPCDDYPTPPANYCTAGYTCTAPLTPYFLKGSEILGSALGPKKDCAHLPNDLPSINPDYYYAVLNWRKDFFNSGSCIVEWVCEVCDKKDCRAKTEPCPIKNEIQGIINTIVDDRQAVDGLYSKVDDFFNKEVSEFPNPSGDSSLFGLFKKNELFSATGCLTHTGTTGHCEGYPSPADYCTTGYTCSEPATRYFQKGSNILSSPFGIKTDCRNIPSELSIDPGHYYAVLNWRVNFWNNGQCIVDWTCPLSEGHVTEYQALFCLTKKAINNIGLCDIISPEDLLNGRKGDMLLRCRDIEPPPIPNCQPDLYNDFFCCSM